MQLSHSAKSSTYLYWALFVGAMMVQLMGLLSPIFRKDCTLYAWIAKHFVESGDYMNIYVYGKDWLDKPHFQFWTSALSMNIFGITDFAFKLPSFLFFLLALFYTYQFAKETRGKKVAQWATLILALGLHIFISNNDVKAEMHLAGLIMGGVYHFYKLKQHFSWVHMILAAAYTSCAIMTKGVFIILIPLFGVGGDIILRKQWNMLFRVRWIGAFLLIGLFITPELYALYSQFDTHPEKTVFGSTDVSGINFFFIDSQFGRFFNNGPISGSQGNIFFFIHTLLWTYSPWAIILYVTLFRRTKSILKGIADKEYYSYSISVFMVLVFSLSGFQLDHYTDILMPFFSILVADYFITCSKNRTTIKISTWTYGISWIVLSGVIEYFFYGKFTVFYISSLILTLIAGYFICRNVQTPVSRFFYLLCLIGLYTGVYLNTTILPRSQEYQGELQASIYMKKHFPSQKLALIHEDLLIQFRLNSQSIIRCTLDDIEKGCANEALVYLSQEDMTKLDEQKIPYTKVKEFYNTYSRVTNSTFINQKTRHKLVSKKYLVEINL